MGCNHSKPDPTQKMAETKCWETILAIINEYNNKQDLAPDWTVTRVDALLSEWVDIPRNMDELDRVAIWTRNILDSKSYIDYTIFQKHLVQLANTRLNTQHKSTATTHHIVV